MCKRRIIVLEITDKERKLRKIDDDFIKNIKIVPLYGGHVNPNMNFEIGFEFPDSIDLIRKRIRVLEFDEIGNILKEEVREERDFT